MRRFLCPIFLFLLCSLCRRYELVVHNGDLSYGMGNESVRDDWFEMIEPVADLLGVDHSRIYANTVFFNDDGSYKDFDEKEYSSRAGCKPDVVGMLKETKGYEKVVMVGDGATDMDARPPADLFIGFGGIVVRDSVKAGADWFVTDFEDMIGPIRK